MIVKFIVKNIADPRLSALFKAPLYLFSDKDNKGFNNFQRKKKQNTNTNNHTQKPVSKQTKKQQKELPINQTNDQLNTNKKTTENIQHTNKTQVSSGFNKFQRKKKQNTITPTQKLKQQIKETKKQEPSIHQTSNSFKTNEKKMQNIQSQNKSQSNSGFGNFQRRKKQKINIQHQEPKNQNSQIKKQQISNKQTNSFSKNEKQTENVQKVNEIKTNTQSSSSGFNNFQRKGRNTKQPTNQNKINQTKQTNNSQQTTEFSNSQKQQNFQRKQQNINKTQDNNVNEQKKQLKQQYQHGFQNFNRVRKPKKPQEFKQQQQKNIQRQNQMLNNKNQQYQQSQQNSIDKKKQQKQNEQILERVRHLLSKNNKKTQTTQTQNQQKQKQKTAQELQKQEQQRELKQKQQFFQKKIYQFKLKQAQSNQQSFFSKNMSWITQKYNQFVRIVYKNTGIDLNATIQPPKFAQSRPQLTILWKILTNKKLLFVLFLILLVYSYEQHIQQIFPQQFNSYMASGNIARITFIQNQFQTGSEVGNKKNITYAIIHLRNGQKYKIVSNFEFQGIVKNRVALMNMMNNPQNMIYIENKKKVDRHIIGQLRNFLGLVMMYLFFTSIMGAKGGRKGAGGKSAFGMQDQSKSKRFLQPVNVKFNDVVGMQKAKQQIVQFIDFLKNPQKYHKLGAKIPRGALLTGPPGTGKTMIAKACAGESQVPFFTISGSQFMQMYVGVGAQRVRDLFQQARKQSPSIIFIDEIDAVGKKRTTGFGGGNDQRDNTLNQLLVQMDGFNTNSNVIVFAATNQKDVLDPALTRPGRFDRMIQVDLPDIQGRKQIFMVHLKPIVIDSQSNMEVYAKRMATLTPGFSGADIKNLCNQAAIMAARNAHKFVTMHDFQLATERVIGGVQKKSHLITPQTKKIVAYHQCGHGVIAWFLQGANPLLKLTIIPRAKGSIGFAQYLPHQSQISTKNKLQDQICVILSGRITQQIFFNKISTGAYDDLQKAFKLAKMIVTQYGMSQKLGWLGFQQSQYAKYYSKYTQQIIDKQILSIIAKCTQRTRKLIIQKKQLIQKLASKLLQLQTIDLNVINQILGPRPFKPNQQYQQYLKQHSKMIQEAPKSVSFKSKNKLSDYIV